jgi:hypothetical protein
MLLQILSSYLFTIIGPIFGKKFIQITVSFDCKNDAGKSAKKMPITGCLKKVVSKTNRATFKIYFPH